jgi:hypothetical protein
LGQFYFGPLRDLRILDYVDGNPKNPPGYDKERGAAMAEAFEQGIGGGDAFFKSLDSGDVSKRTLARLASFCPCGLRSSRAERDLLLDLFLARQKAHHSPEASWRRQSLLLLLHLVREAPRTSDLWLENMLRGAAYSEAFPGGAPWSVPAVLKQVRQAWGIYHRGELLSVAIQGLFWATLHTIALRHQGRVASAAEVGSVAVDIARRALGTARMGATVGKIVDSVRRDLPACAHWSDSGHEIQRAWNLAEISRKPNPTSEDVENVFRESLEVLYALLARGLDVDPYAPFGDALSFTEEDIHLQSLRGWEAQWSGWTVGSWVSWLATQWGVLRHLRVALRKLRIENRDTFRVRPLDGELRLVEVPPVVFTSPRLSSTQQILSDLGLLRRTETWWKLTDLGQRSLDGSLGG